MTKSPTLDSMATLGSSGPDTPNVPSAHFGCVVWMPCQPCTRLSCCWYSGVWEPAMKRMAPRSFVVGVR